MRKAEPFFKQVTYCFSAFQFILLSITISFPLFQSVKLNNTSGLKMKKPPVNGSFVFADMIS